MKKSRDNSHNPGREAASADPEPDFQPTEEDTLALIGKLLLLTQDTEHQFLGSSALYLKMDYLQLRISFEKIRRP